MLSALALSAAFGRQIIDLNAGWEYARVPAPPSVWTGPDAVPTAAWRVQAVSSEETAGESARAAKAIDGNPATFWHTEWSRRQAPYPHSIAIDLGSDTEVAGVRLLPRQTGAQNGRPFHFALLLDGRAVLKGAIPDSASRFEARFPETKGRRLELVFEDGHRPEPFLVLAEIGLIRPTRTGTDWASQYHVSNVRTGDARFDPSAADLEALRREETRGPLRWGPATLPHAAWVRPLNTPDIWQGVAYYRRRISIPAGRRAVLSLQGMQSVDVWLDGRRVAAGRGGYLPLRAALSGGGDLLVRVDNTDNPLIPPGKPQGALDFMYGAGLVGNATLALSDPLHVSDPLEDGGGVRVEEPRVGRDGASTTVATGVRNDGPRKRGFWLRQTLLDPDGRQVSVHRVPGALLPGKAGRYAQSVSIPHPRLWSPDSPALYRLRTTIEEGGKVVDGVETRVGLRTVSVSRERGLLLNGKPLRLVGTNRHQDYPWVGPALSDAANRRDAVQIKRSGHNIVRLSHYNQSPAFLDACDELGILTIPCIPGWQFVNGDPRFGARVLRDIRETVRRDRNHASVAFWEASLNETYPPAALARAWYDAARAEGARIVAGDETPGAPWDVVYNGWKEDLSRPSNPLKPGYIREYGDYEFGGGASTSRAKIGQGTARLLEETWNHVWSYNKFRPQYPATMGAGTWEMFDHNVPWEFAVSASGLMDLMRREKPSFWFYASQAAKRPYLRIAADRGRVVAFTNADAATLFVGGKPFQTLRPPRGAGTGYDLAKAFDGTNTANLPHPPIVFHDVPDGPVKVVAGGLTDALRPAGKPARLRVWLDDLGVPPTRNDLVFVRAAVVDAAGTVCSEDSRRVTLAGAPLAGESTAPCEMGVASFLVRTSVAGGRVSVRAEAGGLAGRCAFAVR